MVKQSTYGNEIRNPGGKKPKLKWNKLQTLLTLWYQIKENSIRNEATWAKRNLISICMSKLLLLRYKSEVLTFDPAEFAHFPPH